MVKQQRNQDQTQDMSEVYITDNKVVAKFSTVSSPQIKVWPIGLLPLKLDYYCNCNCNCWLTLFVAHVRMYLLQVEEFWQVYSHFRRPSVMPLGTFLHYVSNTLLSLNCLFAHLITRLIDFDHP